MAHQELTALTPMRVRAVFQDGMDMFLVPSGEPLADLAARIDSLASRHDRALLSVQVSFADDAKHAHH